MNNDHVRILHDALSLLLDNPAPAPMMRAKAFDAALESHCKAKTVAKDAIAATEAAQDAPCGGAIKRTTANLAAVAQPAADHAKLADGEELRIAYNRAKFSRSVSLEDFTAGWQARAQQAGVDAVDAARQLAIGRAIERACAELPVNFEVEVMLERNAGTVRLCIPEGFHSDEHFDADTFDEQINNAIDAARAASDTQGGG